MPLTLKYAKSSLFLAGWLSTHHSLTKSFGEHWETSELLYIVYSPTWDAKKSWENDDKQSWMESMKIMMKLNSEGALIKLNKQTLFTFMTEYADQTNWP